MYEELNKYVTGEKKLIFFNTFKASRIVEQIGIEEMRKLGLSESEYKLYCIVKDNVGYESDNLGEHIFKDGKAILKLNKILIDGLSNIATEDDVKNYDAKDRDRFTRIDLFFILFHELEHVRQSIMYMTNTVDNSDLYKDAYLDIYFNKIKNDNGYYSDNYKVTTNEVLANIRGVERTIEYFDKYNIELTKEELEILKLKMNKYQELLKNKERINPIDGRAYNLDDLYNIAVQDQTNKVDNLMERTGRKY